MSYTGIFKRFVPFVLTFAVGLFLASFFVSIALPSLSRTHREDWRESECRRMQFEMNRMRGENERIRRENELRAVEFERLDAPAVPPVSLDVPPPPRASRGR